MPEFKANDASLKGDFEDAFISSESGTAKLHYNEIDLSGSEKSEKHEQSIERLLSSYAIGAKLKRLRLRKKIGLVDLGKHTGLSASLLSQLENGKVTPTLPTLARIAMVFDVGIDHFFENQRSKHNFSVTRAKERIRFPDRPDNPLPSYFSKCWRLARRKNDCRRM